MLRSYSLTIAALGFVCLAGNRGAALAADVHWPGWLGGSERSGWVSSFQPPAQWPEALTKKWQVEVGTGYASPLIADGTIFQHARQGERRR